MVKAVVTRCLSHSAACKRCLERHEEILEALHQVLVAKPNPEISGYRPDLLEASALLELSLLDDILTIISKLCLLLQSDCKNFRATHDIVEQTLITLKEMSEDQNHAGLESLKKAPALMEKLCNFNAKSIESKQLQVNNSVTVEHFYSSTAVLFIKKYLL